MAHWLTEELAPRPGRWREAAQIALAATLAMGIALFLQFGSFPAPLLAFKALQPGVASTWRNLWPRLVAIGGSAVVVTFAAGFLVQLPWLLVPAFFVLITAVVYLVPLRTFPIGGYALALTMAGVLFSGIFDPLGIGATALSMSVAFAIGVIVATAFEEIAGTAHPRNDLIASLVGSFTTARTTVATARARLASPPIGGDAATLSTLATHLRLLTLVRQDAHDRVLDRAFVALITIAERASLFAAMADAAARHPARPDFRAAFEPALGAALDAIDRGLAGFADAARRPEAVVAAHDVSLAAAAHWPDFSAVLEALRAAHASAATRDALGPLPAAASAALNGFLQALEGLTDVLHAPPEAFEHLPAEVARETPLRWIPPYDPFALQFALKIGLASVVSLIIGVTAQSASMETVVLNPLILAQGSYGATLRKAGLRIGGVVAGGAIAIFTAATVMANTDNVGVWLMVFFAIMLPCAYISLGTVRFGYFGLQIAATFMIVMVADRPVTDIEVVLWRFYGTLVGALVLFGVFEVVAADYAGRQLVQRFAELLQTVLSGLPESGAAPPPIARTQVLADQVTAGLADILRLAGEACFEGAASGVDPEAALNAAGMLRRVAHRWALIRHGRRTIARPPLPADLSAASADLEHAARDRLTRLLGVLEARHHRARPNSNRHRAACAAARALASCTRPDLDGRWTHYLAAFDAARAGAVGDWPIAAREALYAEVGHLQRIGELLPKLEAELERAVLPSSTGLRPVSASAK
ncbi:MAG: FUSC family protein [bacterium]